jgi:hypothetical protein
MARPSVHPVPRRWRPLLLVALLPLATTFCDPMTGDEVWCEEGVKHLLDCCPGLTADHFLCTAPTGCGNPSTLDGDSGRCIAHASCEALQAAGACADPYTSGRPTCPP